MPTVITHAFIAGITGKAIVKKTVPLRFWLIAVICSIIPDADVIGFKLGIQYNDFFGHRGFFHSLFFAFVLSLLISLVFFRSQKIFSFGWWKYVATFFLIGASHDLLDAFTSGGLGIALLSPFDNTRFFFPWTPIKVSPISLNIFFSRWGFQVVAFEIKYIWLPLLFMLVCLKTVMFFWNKKRQKSVR